MFCCTGSRGGSPVLRRTLRPRRALPLTPIYGPTAGQRPRSSSLEDRTDANSDLPFSPEAATQPSSFKIRSAAATGSSSKPHPIKATPVSLSQETDIVTPRHELKQKFMAEQQKRQINEETLDTLQTEYHTLLKKYAEAENTIDELRLGAKVTLYSDSPAPAPPAQHGTMPPAQHGTVVAVSQRGTAGQTAVTAVTAQRGVLRGK